MNSKHEWKPGDRFTGTVMEISEGGYLILDGKRRVVEPEAVTPFPDYSEWIGKPANELPKWTVCDVDSGMWVTRAIWTGANLCWVKADDSPSLQMSNCKYPVVRIHKLGEPKPKRLRDDPGVWWQTGRRGLACWVETDGGTLVHFNGVDRIYPLCHTDDTIAPDWTRLGPIEGLKIGGAVYGEGE